MAATRYICLADNQYDGKKYYKKDVIYELPGSPPAGYFTATSLDIRHDANIVGQKDMDDTYFFGKGIVGWDDLRFPLMGRRITVSAGRLDFDFEECTVDFSATARYTEEPVCMISQMPHAKKFGTALYPHLHWIQQEDNTPNWLLKYRFYNNGSVVPEFSLAIPTYNAFAYDSGDLLQITAFPPIPAPTGETVSSICDLILFRDSANASTLFAGADPYTVGAKSKEFDLHYQIDSLGSGRELAK